MKSGPSHRYIFRFCFLVVQHTPERCWEDGVRYHVAAVSAVSGLVCVGLVKEVPALLQVHWRLADLQLATFRQRIQGKLASTHLQPEPWLKAGAGLKTWLKVHASSPPGGNP